MVYSYIRSLHLITSDWIVWIYIQQVPIPQIHRCPTKQHQVSSAIQTLPFDP